MGCFPQLGRAQKRDILLVFANTGNQSVNHGQLAPRSSAISFITKPCWPACSRPPAICPLFWPPFARALPICFPVLNSPIGARSLRRFQTAILYILNRRSTRGRPRPTRRNTATRTIPGHRLVDRGESPVRGPLRTRTEPADHTSRCFSGCCLARRSVSRITARRCASCCRG